MFRLQNRHLQLINPLNAELNSICHLLALLETYYTFHVSELRVKQREIKTTSQFHFCVIKLKSLFLGANIYIYIDKVQSFSFFLKGVLGFFCRSQSTGFLLLLIQWAYSYLLTITFRL
jgi:hypothetical protein